MPVDTIDPQPWFWWLVLLACIYLFIHFIAKVFQGYRIRLHCWTFRIPILADETKDHIPGPDGGQFVRVYHEYCPRCLEEIGKRVKLEPSLQNEGARKDYRQWLEA